MKFSTAVSHWFAGTTLLPIFFLLFTAAAFGQTVTTDKADYQPGDTVIVTGTGWQPGETVRLEFDDGHEHGPHVLYTVADGDGNIFNNEFLINESHFGVTFTLTATGQTSGWTAMTQFTDAETQPAAQSLPYAQDFSSLDHSSNTYPAGLQGWKLATSSSTSFRTTAATGDESLIASSSASTTNTGVHNYNGKIGFLAGSSGTTDPSIVLAIKTTGLSNITIEFDIMTIRNPYNGTSNTRINQVDIQYRVGTSGSFTSVSGNANGIYENNTTNQTGSGVTTPQKLESKSFTLPSAANNQSVVQIRWVQRDVSGSGSRPSFAIDNISVTSVVAPSITGHPSNQTITYGASASFTVTATGTSPSYQWQESTNSGSTWTNVSDGGVYSGATTSTLSLTTPPVSMSGRQYRVVVSNSGGSATSNAATLTVNKANATIVVNPYSVTYDGNPHTSTGSATGVLGESLSGLDLSGTTHTNAGSYTDSWTFTDVTGNYNNASGTVNNNIDKADPTIVVNPYSVTYDGNPHTSTGSATGVMGESLAGLDLSGTTHTNAGSYTDSWTFTDVTGNYNNASGTVNNNIGKANATIVVNPYSVTYDGNPHTSTGSATGVLGESLGGLDLSGTTHTNAGSYTDSWTFTDVTGNYNNASGTVNNNIDKANATIVVNPYSVTYDGNPHTSTGSATGVLGESLSGLDLSGTTHTNAGSYTDSWTFTDVTGNYNNASGTVNNNIGKANATIVVNPYSVTYDGNPHTSTGSATGVLGESLSGLDLSGTTHTNAGSYTDSWTFTDVTGNYNNASGTVNNNIGKANATIVVNPYSVTYDGNPHTSTGSATGVLGESLSGLDLSGTTHTNAGSYTDSWTFTDVTGNYNNASGTVNNSIDKATPTATLAVSNSPQTYDGTAKSATVSITSSSVPGSVANILTGGAATQTNAGTYPVTADFVPTDAANYNSLIGLSAGNFVIDKADPTIVVNPYSVTYDGNPHTSTGSATGVLGESLSGLDLSGTTHTNAGSYTDSWTFTDVTGNYNNASGTVNNNIDKANATIVVNPYSVTYDGNPHTSTGSATGVLGESLSGLDLSGTTHTNAGSYTDSWTFTDVTGNYNNASGTVNNNIGKANATIVVNPYSVTYDGNPHTSTGSATGAAGENLSSLLDLTGTTHTAAGTYVDTWSFAGDGNHNSASGSVTNTIGQATLTITAGNASRQYSDPDPPFTYAITGFVNGDNEGNLSGTLSLTTSATGTSGPGNYPIIPSGYTSSNYNIVYVNGTLTITKENAIAEYTGPAFFATYSSTSPKAKITLSATIKDTVDGYPGNITNAKVEFREGSPTGSLLGSADLPVGLVNNAEPTVGTATAEFEYTLTSSEFNNNGTTLTVYVVVKGWYCGTGGPELVSIAVAAKDNVSGGGYIVLQNSNGQYKGSTGSKNNFGYTMKYNKSGKNLQGQANIIVRNKEAGKTYQIKSNAINSLVATTSTSSKKATFTTKANMKDITDPLNPIDLGGNLTLQVDMTDASTDMIAITLWNSNGGLYYSSNWNGTKTLEQSLAGGNVSVLGGGLAKGLANLDVEDGTIPLQFDLYQNYPNPFNPSTRIRFDIPEVSDVKLLVYDLLGRQIATLFEGELEPGRFERNWDGRDASGLKLSSGVYFFRMEARSKVSDQQFTGLKKMIMLK